ncbi:hypothetical protein Tco_1216164 [Tanacetum coccineum]
MISSLNISVMMKSIKLVDAVQTIVLTFTTKIGDSHQTTAISNIKLLILKKEEYDIWAMEIEHYREYIDNDVWKLIQNGNSKKRISTRKDGVIRILPPVTALEIQAVEKERKVRIFDDGPFSQGTYEKMTWNG